jgi:AcrR family transcriptional regulator
VCIRVKGKRKKRELDTSPIRGFNSSMGILERKLREKEQRIQEILNAARVLFITKGYGNTTMLDIAEESELSRRTLYLYFSSKEELSYRVMKESYDYLLNKLRDAVEVCTGSAYESLISLGDAYLAFYKEDFDQLVSTLLFDYQLVPDDENGKEGQDCIETIQAILTVLTTVLEEGQRDNSLIALENPRRTAFTYMTMIQSTMQKLAVRKNWVLEDQSIGGGEIMKEMFHILFSSIKNNS